MSAFHNAVPLLQSRRTPIPNNTCKAISSSNNVKYGMIATSQSYPSVTPSSGSGPRSRDGRVVVEVPYDGV